MTTEMTKEQMEGHLAEQEAFANTVVSSHPDYTPNYVDFTFAVEVLKLETNDINVRILKGSDDSAYLQWNDGVANEWIEHYTSLVYALGRLTLLQACAESNWEKGFTQNPTEFVTEFNKFLDVAV